MFNRKNKKLEYKQKNDAYFQMISKREGVVELRGGVLMEMIAKGDSETKPGPRSIVTCHYKGSLIPKEALTDASSDASSAGKTEGRVFDETFTSGCPAAFRVNELIPGFQIALVNMVVGDRVRVYIPSEMGYGSRGAGSEIPGNSTLIFEIQLIAVG